jgi:4-hydroxybenzoate polyprenyltransferase
MKLADIIILALCVAALIIGAWETYTRGLAQSYFILMISMGLLFWYQLRRQKQEKSSNNRKN